MIEQLELSHAHAISHPVEMLEKGEKFLFNENDIPLSFDPSRGDIPVLRARETDHVFVIANGGAQLMNSPVYLERGKNPNSDAIVNGNAKSIAASMLVYSKPGDTFVYTTDHEQESFRILQQVHDSFAKIDVPLSQVYMPVSSVDDFIERYGGKVNIIPTVMAPQLVVKYATEGRMEAAMLRTLMNVSAYTKDGIQELWQKLGVPTPATRYALLSGHDIREMAQIVSQEFTDYQELVINRTDGSGGYGIIFTPKDALDKTLSLPEFRNQRVQMQGKLNLITSPGLVANIDLQGNIAPLIVSKQIFSEPGAFAGNMWRRDADFTEYDPSFMETNMKALEALAYAGIFGQVSVDSILISSEDAQRYGVSQTTMREANIRPGGSSVVNRIRQGTIEGKPITSVLTSTKIEVEQKAMFSGEFQRTISSLDTPSLRVVLYNYNIEHKTASVAFAGTEEVSEEMLLAKREELVGKVGL